MKNKISIYVIVCVSIMTFILSGTSLNVQANESTPSLAGIVTTAGGNLNIRAQADTNSAIVSKVQKGTYLSIIEERGNFYKVIYQPDKIGYCHKNYVTVQNGSFGAYVNTSSTALNVRSGASVNHSVIASLYKGESVVVISSHNNFYKILYRGSNVGYASASYIKAREKNITLNVPSFKQYDNRWSAVKLGNSSKTIAQSGCLTTAIAMEQSYSYGHITTPDIIASTATYTSEGSIYWPTAYEFIQGNDYLTKILALLKQGKPVIVGGKTSVGKQHWVIVTGYIPNGNVSADDFLINDPGSGSRKDLGSFFSAYPIFYKAAYRK